MCNQKKKEANNSYLKKYNYNIFLSYCTLYIMCEDLYDNA